MLRVPVLCLALFAAAWFEFSVFPGHSYLEGNTQLYLPMLERMDAPGFLSRDLVATNPTLALTAYDEVTLLLHEVGRQPFRRTLLGQEFIFRMAALLGVFLLLRSTGLSYLFAFVLSTVVNFGATIVGPAVFLTDREPLPGAFAFSLTLLAMGLLIHEKPLLAGVAGGLAFLYDPVLAMPFWCVLVAAFFLDKEIKYLIRPTLPIFLVFALLLANLAQLQPGTAADPIFSRISAPLGLFQRTYTPYLYVSAWPSRELWQILALATLGVWAASRYWSLLNRVFRWLLLGTGLCGLLSIPFSFLLLDQAGFTWIARLQPTRTLLFTVAAAAVLFGLAGMRAILQRSAAESLAWFFLLFLLPVSHGIFDFTHFAIALALAALLTALLFACALKPLRFVTIAVPVIAAVAFSRLLSHNTTPIPMQRSLSELATWADGSTWGSSMFLFPDAGRASYPGVFRAQSRHPLWADWKSAQGVAYSESAARHWQDRWRDTMEDGFSAAKLETMLPLPIDYYVLRKQNELANARPAFVNRDFVVYDAEDFRNAPKPLKRSN